VPPIRLLAKADHRPADPLLHRCRGDNDQHGWKPRRPAGLAGHLLRGRSNTLQQRLSASDGLVKSN
jgi:hypothetical protein